MAGLILEKFSEDENMHNNTDDGTNGIITLPEMNIETIFGSGKLTDFIGNNLVIFSIQKTIHQDVPHRHFIYKIP